MIQTVIVTRWRSVARRGHRVLPRRICHYWIVVPLGPAWLVYWRPWVGLQIRWKGAAQPVGGIPSVLDPGWREVVEVKRPTAIGGEGGSHQAPLESEVLRDHLSLIEHCAVTQYDDGSPREPGWITIRVQGRAWVVDVKDPASCMSFRALGETVDDALETARLMLSTDQAPWEPDQWLKRRQSPKKK